MPSLDIQNCEMGTIASRADHSVAFRVITPELRPSEAGALMAWHGRACRVTIHPHEGEPDEVISVKTEMDRKTPSQRMRGVLFLIWKAEGQPGSRFDPWYEDRMEQLIEKLKAKLDP